MENKVIINGQEYSLDLSKIKGTIIQINTPSLTLEDLERGRNQILYGQWLTDKEMKIHELSLTKVGKIIYG